MRSIYARFRPEAIVSRAYERRLARKAADLQNRSALRSLFFTEGSSSCRARGQMVPASLYKAQEPAGQFANPVLLATVDGVRKDQFTAYAERYGPREDEFGCVLLIHAP